LLKRWQVFAGRILTICCILSIGALDAMARSPDRPSGIYVGAGCFGALSTNCLDTGKNDVVKISHVKENRATVSIRLVFDRGFTCHLDGEAKYNNSQYILVADGLDPRKPCRLILHLTGSQIELEDPEDLCREVYCGAGASLDGARFKKRTP
jgi:hypothetical protein